MNYYAVETAMGTSLAKSKNVWRSAAQASKEKNFPIQWVRPISATTYFALLLRKKILKKGF